jgi:prophage tail gpP-like protein
MSLRVRRYLSVTYTLEGHGQRLNDGTFVPYAVDSIVRVIDEPGGLNALLWVIGRTFEKSRSGGTTTRLELIIPGSLQFGEV